MSEKLEELPLFPLQTVLFPHAEQYLHVFEPRYKEMVELCLEQDRPFGVVLIRSGSETDRAEPYLVGTAVRIVGMQTYDDGRMDIQVRGERRFRIRTLDDSKPYLVGYVEPVVDVEFDEKSETPELLARAKDEFEMLVQRAFPHREFDVHVIFPPDPVALSFAIASLLQMENLDKQHLLETTDTSERVSALLPILESQIMEVKDRFYKIGSKELAEWITPN